MERRSFLKALSPSVPTTKTLTPPTAGFEPYAGPWSETEAAHLLRRTTYGPNHQQIKDAVSLGLDGTINLLTEDLPLPPPPVNYDFDGDPDVPLGATWVDAPYNIINNTNGYRRRSIYAWVNGRLLTGEMNIREKMVMFWHNHFVVADLNDARFYYRYMSLFRSKPLPDFRQLTKDITIDPAMLRYLNGNQNSKAAPNENYARELLELFTIGKGPLVGPGDYTNYTEDDVVQIAKVLTGWRDSGYTSTIQPTIGSSFFLNRHDTTTKKLSPRFGSVTISNQSENEYKVLIDIIFQQKEVARFICRKLYRWFLFYKIDETVEAEIIEPMAQLLVDNNYNMKPVVIAFLKSAHFNEASMSGCMIKNPLDFLSKLVNQFKLDMPTALDQQYRLWLNMANYCTSLQMRPFFHPNVAGWAAFYQEPSFYQIWLNAVTLPLRQQLTDSICSPNAILANIRVDVNPIAFIETLNNPLDINVILQDLNILLLSKPFTESQIEILKEIALPGLPDYEWTLEYQMYKDNPTNNDLRRAIETKIRNLLTYIMRMPEFQLS